MNFKQQKNLKEKKFICILLPIIKLFLNQIYNHCAANHNKQILLTNTTEVISGSRLGKMNQILPFMLMTSISPASPATISPSTVSMSPPLALISPKTLIGFGTALKTIGFIFLKMRYFKYQRLSNLIFRKT